MQDLTGQVFAFLEVVEFDRVDPGYKYYWKVKCINPDCDLDRGIFSVRADQMKPNKKGRIHTTSCGCVKNAKAAENAAANRLAIRERTIEEVVGQNFGELTVTSFHESRGGHDYYWCACSCGEMTSVMLSRLRSEYRPTRSCKHLREKSPSENNLAAVRKSNTTHGMTNTPEYISWSHMLSRCYNPNATSYPYYGARGIIVCDEWRNSFEQFYLDMGTRPEGMTLDRIDPNGNYEPINVRWATKVEQANNRRPRSK